MEGFKVLKGYLYRDGEMVACQAFVHDLEVCQATLDQLICKFAFQMLGWCFDDYR